MQLGAQVRGLMMNLHWRFVTADAHDVHIAVNQHDANARLAAHEDTQQLGVVRFVEREHLGEGIDDIAKTEVTPRGGAFLLVFFPRNPDGSYMHGEPDATVVEQLRERDVWARRRGVNEREMLNHFEMIEQLREAKSAERLLEKMTARTEERLFGWAHSNPNVDWAPGKIYVPARVAAERAKEKQPAVAAKASDGDG